MLGVALVAGEVGVELRDRLGHFLEDVRFGEEAVILVFLVDAFHILERDLAELMLEAHAGVVDDVGQFLKVLAQKVDLGGHGTVEFLPVDRDLSHQPLESGHDGVIGISHLPVRTIQGREDLGGSEAVGLVTFNAVLVEGLATFGTLPERDSR